MTDSLHVTSRQTTTHSGHVCIVVHKNLYFSKINLSCNCKEKDLQISAVELENKLIILSFTNILSMAVIALLSVLITKCTGD